MQLVLQEIATLELRCQAAEGRHEELAAKFPEATKPLLRQLEAARTDAETQAQVWAVSERSLLEQLDQAEAQAALAVEKEKLASERVQVVSFSESVDCHIWRAVDLDLDLLFQIGMSRTA